MLEKLLGECRSIASSIQSLVARLHDSKVGGGERDYTSVSEFEGERRGGGGG